MPLESRALLFRISAPADPAQPAVVEVDGQNVAAQVEGLRLDMAEQKPSILTLYGPAAGDIEGDAIVRVMVNGDPRAALVELLAGINPQQLEQAALRRLDFDDTAEYGLTAAMLRELTEAAGRG